MRCLTERSENPNIRMAQAYAKIATQLIVLAEMPKTEEERDAYEHLIETVIPEEIKFWLECKDCTEEEQ
jgi:hypothetical protein